MNWGEKWGSRLMYKPSLIFIEITSPIRVKNLVQLYPQRRRWMRNHLMGDLAVPFRFVLWKPPEAYWCQSLVCPFEPICCLTSWKLAVRSCQFSRFERGMIRVWNLAFKQVQTSYVQKSEVTFANYVPIRRIKGRFLHYKNIISLAKLCIGQWKSVLSLGFAS